MVIDQNLGVEGIAKLVEKRNLLNLEMTEKLSGTGLFVFLNDNSYYRTAFVFFPEKCRSLLKESKHQIPEDFVLDRINHYTEKICDTLYKEGKVVFDKFTLIDINKRLEFSATKPVNAMGMAIGNFEISEDIKRTILSDIVSTGKVYEQDFNRDLLAWTSHIAHPQDNDRNNISPASW